VFSTAVLAGDAGRAGSSRQMVRQPGRPAAGNGLLCQLEGAVELPNILVECCKDQLLAMICDLATAASRRCTAKR
jgi:hypothetical protein